MELKAVFDIPKNKKSSHPQRKSPRLKDYDYAQNGAYFATILTHRRANLFGYVDKNGIMHLNDFGNIVSSCWNDLPKHYANIELDAFVIMPNHVHGIILITTSTSTGVREGFKPSLHRAARKKNMVYQKSFVH